MLPKETIKQVYNDGLQPAVKKTGSAFQDLVQSARLLTLPIQGLAFMQDWLDIKRKAKLDGMVERMSKRVPEERRIEAQPEVVGPALEHMRYLDDTNALWQMFEEVLTKSIDKDHIDEVHPSFPKLIAQLSRDEAWLLYRLRENKLKLFFVQRLYSNVKTKQLEFTAPCSENYIRDDIPRNELIAPKKMEIYQEHLVSIGLAVWPIYDTTPQYTENGGQWGNSYKSALQLTEFGKLFVKACIPEKGFETLKPEE